MWLGSFRFRYAIIILVGTLGFLLGSLYLFVDKMAIDYGIQVTGPSSFHAGEEAVLRVNGWSEPASKPLPVKVLGGHWQSKSGETKELPFEALEGTPTLVRLSIPREANEGGSLLLSLRVAGFDTRELGVPLPIGPVVSLVSASGEEPPLTTGGLRVNAVPEDGAVVGMMDNRVFVLVQDAEDHPVEADLVLDFNGKKVRRSSDENGLALFFFDGGVPGGLVSIEATDSKGRKGRYDEPWNPVPRGHRMRISPRVVGPGEVLTAEIQTRNEEAHLHCDLVQDGRHLDSFSALARGGRATIERPAPEQIGVYTLQCSPFSMAAGQSYAARRFVVDRGPGSDINALAAAVVPHGDADDSYLSALVSRRTDAKGEHGERLRDYLAARLQPEFVPSVSLANSYAKDEAELSQQRAGTKNKLLVALAIALSALVVWAVGLIGANIVEVRRREQLMTEHVEGADDLASDELEDMLPEGPGRSLFPYLVFAVFVILNVIGVIWLLAAFVG